MSVKSKLVFASRIVAGIVAVAFFGAVVVDSVMRGEERRAELEACYKDPACDYARTKEDLRREKWASAFDGERIIMVYIAGLAGFWAAGLFGKGKGKGKGSNVGADDA